jgi:ATP-dependent Clp protease adaptor protein ClpS
MGTTTTTKTETKIAIKPVNMWRVVLHNDDYTPMDFVTALLVGLFNKNAEEAEMIMLNIHKTGRGVAGVYTKEIATTKAKKTCEISRLNGHPLLATAEEA